MAADSATFTNFYDALEARLVIDPEREGFTFLTDDAEVKSSLRYAELDAAARSVAAALMDVVPAGARAMLLFSGGSDFVVAFYACLFAGVIAVPVHTPHLHRPQRGLPHINAIAADAGASAVLTTAAIRGSCEPYLEAAPALTRAGWIAIDEVDLTGATVRREPTDGLAFLQYTSGSTGRPKGVVVSHANLLANAGMIERAMDLSPARTGLLWLPFFHDMGLMSGVLTPVFAGYRILLLSPNAFMKRPLVWLEAISRYGVQVSGGPNFAYDFCCERAQEIEPSDLDLSSWAIAFNGSEPIRAETLDRFAAVFGRYGFEKKAFMPCYGLAEATLMVSCSRVSTGDVMPTLDAMNGVPVGMAATGPRLVSSGPAAAGCHIEIIDPVSARPLKDLEIGEITVSGAHISGGYWGRPEETAQAFLQSSATEQRPILRTGDLGLVKNGELYVVGRIKELIKLRGRGIAPNDVEASAERAHAGVRRGGVVAVGVPAPDGEQLALAIEATRQFGRQPDPELLQALFRAVLSTLSEDHGVVPVRMMVVSPGCLPRTTSGKLRRVVVQEHFIGKKPDPQIKILGEWSRLAAAPSTDRIERLCSRVQTYLRSRVNSALIDDRRTIPPSVVLEFADIGLFGLDVPEADGGLGLTQRESLRIIEQIAAYDLTLALFVGLHNALGIGPLLRHGSPEQRRRYLPSLAQGRALAAFALTEDGAGSNPHAITARADREPDGTWILSGSKIWSGTSGWAKYVTVVAQGFEGDTALGSVALLVDTGLAGVVIGSEALTMGMRGMIQNRISFESVRIAPDCQIGACGRGLSIAGDVLMRGRLGIAAMCLGAMQRAVQLGARYAGRRTVGAGLLGNIPETRSRLSDHLAATEILRALIDATADSLDDQDVDEPLLIASKLWGSERLWLCIDDMMQMLGGRGYIETNILPQMMRDARVLRVFEGPTEVLQHHIGALALSTPATVARSAERLCPDAALDCIDEAVSRALTAFESGPWSDQTLDHARQAKSFAAGRLVIAALVRSAATRCESRDARDFAERAWRDAVDHVTAAGQFAPRSFDVLSTRIQSICSAAPDGDSESMAPDQQLDSLLRAVPARVSPPPTPSAGRSEPTAGRVWLAEWLSRRLDIAAVPDEDWPLASIGVDSIMAVTLASDVGSWIGREIEPTLIWDFPTVRHLIDHLDHLWRTSRSEREDHAAAAVATEPDAVALLLDELESTSVTERSCL